jgi:hypothetical protein
MPTCVPEPPPALSRACLRQMDHRHASDPSYRLARALLRLRKAALAAEQRGSELAPALRPLLSHIAGVRCTHSPGESRLERLNLLALQFCDQIRGEAERRGEAFLPIRNSSALELINGLTRRLEQSRA